MSPKDLLARLAEQARFTVSVESDVVRASGVPCLLKGQLVSTCTIEKSYDHSTGKPDSRIGEAEHGVRVVTDQESDGRVYHADGTGIGNHISGDGKTWSNISIKKGPPGKPEDDATVSDLIYRYATHIVGAVHAADEVAPATFENPFNIPNTFEARAGIVPVQDRIRYHRLAIIGLGGTGAYILDLVSKTPVRAIHLFDEDYMNWHNFMRAPGAPTEQEIEVQHQGGIHKVDYHLAKYAPLRQGIYRHALHVDNKSAFKEFLSGNPIDFAFVCIDQLTESVSPRQDVVYDALTEAKLPFIDSGISITVEDRAITGSVTTSFYAGGSVEWRTAIPIPKVTGPIVGYRNTQLPEVNALAATLAVMEWRRRTGQYASNTPHFLHKFRIETPAILWP